VTAIHRLVGFSIFGGLLVIFIAGVVLRMRGADEAPKWFRALQYYVENVLVLQTVIGTVLFFAMGKRVAGGDLVFLHYFYGSLFPLIAVISGRISGLRRETRQYVGWTWGAFFAWALTTRALMTGLGIGI
jgi:hypothetical protein